MREIERSMRARVEEMRAAQRMRLADEAAARDRLEQHQKEERRQQAARRELTNFLRTIQPAVANVMREDALSVASIFKSEGFHPRDHAVETEYTFQRWTGSRYKKKYSTQRATYRPYWPITVVNKYKTVPIQRLTGSMHGVSFSDGAATESSQLVSRRGLALTAAGKLVALYDRYPQPDARPFPGLRGRGQAQDFQLAPVASLDPDIHNSEEQPIVQRWREVLTDLGSAILMGTTYTPNIDCAERSSGPDSGFLFE